MSVGKSDSKNCSPHRNHLWQSDGKIFQARSAGNCAWLRPEMLLSETRTLTSKCVSPRVFFFKCFCQAVNSNSTLALISLKSHKLARSGNLSWGERGYLTRKKANKTSIDKAVFILMNTSPWSRSNGKRRTLHWECTSLGTKGTSCGTKGMSPQESQIVTHFLIVLCSRMLLSFHCPRDILKLNKLWLSDGWNNEVYGKFHSSVFAWKIIPFATCMLETVHLWAWRTFDFCFHNFTPKCSSHNTATICLIHPPQETDHQDLSGQESSHFQESAGNHTAETKKNNRRICILTVISALVLGWNLAIRLAACSQPCICSHKN